VFGALQQSLESRRTNVNSLAHNPTLSEFVPKWCTEAGDRGKNRWLACRSPTRTGRPCPSHSWHLRCWKANV